MARTLPMVAAIAVVVSCGLAHGLWSRRWTATHDLEAAVARLPRVAKHIGDWEGQDQEFDRTELEQAEISGYIKRWYQNRRDGSAVSILLVCGRTGAIAVHSPDVCYPAAGYDLAGEAVRVNVRPGGDGPPAEFWRGDFRKAGGLFPEGLRIYWAWSDGRAWKAPDQPRLTFADSPILYKLYLVHRTDGDQGQTTGPDPSAAFLPALLADLRTSLSPSP